MQKRAIEKLKVEYEKVSYDIKQIINDILVDQVNESEEFASKVLNKDKDTTKMWKFITDCARKHLTKNKGSYVDPSIVYSLAIHYFEEDKPEYVEEMFDIEPLEFGVKRTEFNINKVRIVKELEKEVIKEVEKITKKQIKVIDSSLSEYDLISIKKSIEDKLKNIENKRVVENKEEVKEEIMQQLDLFAESEE